MAKYQQYEGYKDSGIEWLGEIPKDWNIARVKNQFDVFNGSTPKSGEAEYWEGNIVWVTPSDLSQLEGYKISESSRNITTKGLHSCGTSLVPKGSMILSCRAPIGSLAVAGTELCTNQGCKTLVPTSGIPVEYYYYYFSTVTNVLNNLGRGSTFLELSTEDLTNLAMPLPSISESYSVVAFLDHETAQIDTLIEKQQTLIQLLKEKRQAIISHAVTKGLNADAPMKDSGVEWLGEVPEHWDVVKLSYRYEVLLGKMLDDKKITGAYLGGYIRNTDVQWNGINTENLPQMDFRPEERERYSVKKGDLVVCEGGDIGRSAIWDKEEDCFYQKALHRLRPHDSTRDNAKFMLYVMFDAVHQERFSGGLAKATIAHLPAEKFRQYKFVYPPYAEQIKISAYLDEMSSKFESIETSAQRQVELLQERRTALISAAVTGKIDVRGWQAAE